nr:MAG TPA: hypothetical protein [Caudoviricetes sp.]
MAFDYVTEQVQEKRVPDIGLLSLSTMVTALNEYIGLVCRTGTPYEG